MKVRIEIDTKTFIRFWLVVIGFGLSGLFIYSLRDALIVLGAGLFLALALNGPVTKLAHKFPGKSRLGGTALAFAIVMAVICAVVWFVIPPIVEQTAKFTQTIPTLVEEVNNQWTGFRHFIDDNNLRPQVDTALENIKQESIKWTADVSSNIISSISSLAVFIGNLFLTIVIAFLILLEGPAWLDKIWSLYRDKERMKHHKKLASKTYTMVNGYIIGQLTVALIGALFSGAFVFIMTLFFRDVASNLAIPIMLAVFLLSLIPMFGATIAGVAVTLLLMFNNFGVAVVYAIFFILYQQIENNFIVPAIQAKKVELSALIVLVAVTLGVYAAGVIGGFLAIPIAGSIKIFVDDYIENRDKKYAKEDDKAINKIIKKIRQ